MDTMMMTIAMMGIIVGIFTNLVPILGGSFFNFALGLLIVSYQTLSGIIAIPSIPPLYYVFLISYLVGTFLVKVLALLPIPFIQPLAQALKGGN